ncbi:hypothetical protein A3862_07990 [Methylobacterium sp. XJLW]|jgi:hypothetical protein|nr:hypothetical protein A3862_07990 [Methylobacterium sp. XJLW]SFU70095.1 hypothetical protein SAMN02799643_01914 [Methylobacterium sp. UNCCL125]
MRAPGRFCEIRPERPGVGVALNACPNGFFAWKSRPAARRQREDLVLLTPVRSTFALSHETYGSPV